MTYKYSFLKNGMGVVVFLEVETLTVFKTLPSDYRIDNGVYLRISGPTNLKKETVEHWCGRGIKDMLSKIESRVGEQSLCFDIRSIDFDLAHFAEPSLYCAVQGYLAKTFDILSPTIEVEYDKSRGGFIFHIPDANE